MKHTFQKLVSIKKFCKMYEVGRSTAYSYKALGFLNFYKPKGATKNYIDITEFEENFKKASTIVLHKAS